MARIRVTIVAPRVAWRSPRSRFLAGSFVVHVVCTGAFVWAPTLWRGPVLHPDALAVELVGALPDPEPAAAPPSQSLPSQEPEPPPVDEGPALAPPSPTPKATLRPTPKPTARPTPPRPQPAASSPPSPAPDAAGGSAPTAGSASAGGSVSALGGLDAAFSWYRAAVTQALYARWQRPIVSGLAEPIDVRVAFEILRDGRVRDLRIAEPSGVQTLDRSALRAVSDAVPLPPLPAGMGAPTLAASFVFRLYPERG